MHQALIVARMAPGSAPDIAKIFAESDRGELPHLVGVVRRSPTARPTRCPARTPPHTLP
ncbi:TcmI family type II polyketide cyclase, partial [Streptomyces sp. NPDC001759]